jgi:uncharacterized membrane protein
VSADGGTVVGTSRSAANFEAFLWTSANGIQRLWNELVTLGVDPAADGWSFLNEATAITPDARFIVGYGSRNGRLEAFLAELSSAAPRLDFSRTTEGLELEWPSGYRLQRSPSIAPAQWENAAGESPTTVSTDGPSQFYRLVPDP